MSEARQTEILEELSKPLIELSETADSTFDAKALLAESVMVLRKIEYHLSILSGAELNDYDV